MKRAKPAKKPTKAIEVEHDFTLILTGISGLTDEAVDALYEAGCDDATIGCRCCRVFVSFDRCAPSLKEAILSAIKDIKKANIGADVLRVDQSNIVTQSDIARRIGRTRQLVHQYMNGKRGPGDFPPAIHHDVDGPAVWLWSEVAEWLWRNDMIKESVFREAHDVAAINCVLDFQHLRQVDPIVASEVGECLVCAATVESDANGPVAAARMTKGNSSAKGLEASND